MASTLTQNPLLAGGSLRVNPLVPLQDQQDAALPAGDPSGYTMAGNALVSGIQQQRAQSVSMGLLDPNTGWPTSAGWKDAAQQYANGLLMGSTAPRGNGLLAYHGSPHDFDAFSLDKIGTGEGAQAYGRGLYFAENPQVAQNYRDALSKAQVTAPDGGSQAGFNGLDNEFYNVAKNAAPRLSHEDHLTVATNVTDALRKGEDLEKLRSDMRATPFKSLVPAWDAAIDHAKQFEVQQVPGRMYEVNLNVQPHELLDWDKPLSEQHPQVQQALGQFGTLKPEWTGGQVYESSRLVPGDYRDPVAATQALQAAGIKGIRYLDQGSRGAGKGTSNFVIFDPATIEILRKYGLAGLGLGTAAAAADQPTTP